MKRIDSASSTLLVLKRGEELHASLVHYATEAALKGAWLSGLGGVSGVTLGFYDITSKSYQWQEFSEPLEILSLAGNLSIVDGKPFWHIHGTFSGRDYRSVGGHVKELSVGLTCELLITPLDTPLTRLSDDETGLKLLEKSP